MLVGRRGTRRWPAGARQARFEATGQAPRSPSARSPPRARDPRARTLEWLSVGVPVVAARNCQSGPIHLRGPRFQNSTTERSWIVRHRARHHLFVDIRDSCVKHRHPLVQADAIRSLPGPAFLATQKSHLWLASLLNTRQIAGTFGSGQKSIILKI